MRFTRRIISVAVLAAGIALVPAAALAASPNGQTITDTQNIHGLFYEPNATNPCNGDTFNGGAGVLFDGNLVEHSTFFTQSDEGWFTFTETGKVTGTDDGTGVAYTGKATAWGNGNFNERNTNNAFTLTIHLTGSDGSAITAHQTAVFVLNANGTVTVSFTKTPVFSCG